MLKNFRKKRRKTNNKKRKQRSRMRIYGGIGLFVSGTFFFMLFLIANQPPSEPTGTFAYSEEEFIDEMASEAMVLQENYDIIPSVTIAQAILESNWGRSELAQEDSNYFGIKGDSDNPQYVTREYTNEWIEIETSFESYDSWEDSMEDYAELLAEGPSWDPQLYHNVIEAQDYEEAAYALQDAGYATDPDYPEKVITLIERHDLDRFDD